MSNPIDPQDIINQADDLLADIKSANAKFIDKTNKTVKAINQSFKVVDKINDDLNKAQAKAQDKIDDQILNYLEKTQ